ncbi:class I SAM-dependent methyltransferase [Aliigemmobacter aestuarii]|uniref:Class I SAM-dependent methyltransferase n=1 Tax=Aliigemmobacter aestuarii TaxID=1445661 RepID=A0A4S3MTB4_9RHOB|nr:SAM-dependent methyltransferase [Gemmobacter aestuarii]THD85850.1 class I SAM-dependent methyltransferase [Gemmobacter aestuarii]
MTPLADILIRRIAAAGPMTLADYMAECLLHPDHGYYTTRPPFGAKGDFTTAPEISQMFGELMGLALAQAWLDHGAPGRFTLAEPGPGRGTLMADVLRATRGVPGFHHAAQVLLIEASPALRAEQARTLAAWPVAWADSLTDLPEQPLFLVANEFFDALPIRQFTRQGDGWAETMVGLVEGRLRLGRAPAAPLAALAHRLADTAEGDIVEVCPAAAAAMAGIAGRIARHGGAALITDYGGWRSLGDTFQAMEDHAYADPLARPGRADLTAHVDFEALALAAAPCQHAIATQGAFLERLGIAQRAARLAQSLHGAALESHLAATRRLTDPEEMGSLFKTLALCRAGDPLPPGFA